jgi:hypothetical protein
MPRKPADTTHISLRIREDLRRKLEREAQKRRVSMNSEIRFRLEDSFEAQSLKDHGELNRAMEIVMARYARLYALEQRLIAAMERSSDPEVAKAALVVRKFRDDLQNMEKAAL